MTSYFDSDKNFARLLAELERWRGTPFLEGVGKAGIGADCVRFVEAVLVNLGAIDPVPFPPYVTRGGGEAMLQIFECCCDNVPKMRWVWKRRSDPTLRSLGAIGMRGDVLLVSRGKDMHHLSIVAEPPTVWHCLREVGEANLYDPVVVKNLHAVYRVKP